MENSVLMRKRYKKTILLVELATFFGCSAIMLNGNVYKNPFFGGILFLYIIGLFIGAFISFLLILAAKAIFRSFLRDKITYIIFLIALVFLSYWVGIFSSEYTWRILLGTL